MPRARAAAHAVPRRAWWLAALLLVVVVAATATAAAANPAVADADDTADGFFADAAAAAAAPRPSVPPVARKYGAGGGPDAHAAAAPAAAAADDDGPIALPPNLLAVPLYAQQTNYSCGPAAVLALLWYWDWPRWRATAEQDLYGPLQTRVTTGTNPQPMADFLVREARLGATVRYDGDARGGGGPNVTAADVRAAIDAGHPPIVDLEAWRDPDVPVPDPARPYASDWADGHFNVAVGYDVQRLFVMDPLTAGNYAYVRWHELADVWAPGGGGGRWHDVVDDDDTHAQHPVIFVTGPIGGGGKGPYPVPPTNTSVSHED